MRILITTLLLMIAFNSWADECSNTEIELSKNGNKLIAVHFMADDKNYILKRLVGRIVSLDINASNGGIDSLVLESKGIEDGFNVPDGHCISDSMLSQAEKGWIDNLFRKGTKVKVYFYSMGSAGLPVIRKISPLR